MRRIFPAPVLSLGLLVLWILLMQSASPGTLALGLVLAVFWPWFAQRIRPTPVRVRHPLLILKLFARVVVEMLRSNVEVAVAILTQRSADIRSGFVQVPLELRDPNALAVLAMIVTATPGTAWAQVSADRSILLIHVLSIKSEADLVALIKNAYEAPLRRIFE